MRLGDITVGDDSGNSSGVSTPPSDNTSALISLASNVASVFAPKTGVPVTVGIAPQTQSFISIALFGIGGLLVLNMLRK
jgi:hypothetical protein